MRCPHWRVPGPVGIFPPDILLRAKLDQAAKGVSDKLAKKTPLGAGEHIDVEEVPRH